jgi:hypothetical protein
LRLALSFFTWRTLVHEGGLKRAAVDAMVQAAVCANEIQRKTSASAKKRTSPRERSTSALSKGR